MEDPAKKREHSMPSNYVTLQQLQERRLREQQQREEEERQRQLQKQREEEEEERQRQLQKQREEEEERQRRLRKQREEKENNRNRQHGKSVQSQRIKAAGRAEKKISSGGVETLATEGEIKGQEGGVNSNKGKKKRQKPKGKRSLCVGKAKQEEGSARSDHGEIVQNPAIMNVSYHREMDGVDGLSEKSTDGKRQVHWRAKTLRRETVVTGEKTTEMNGSERNLQSGKGCRNRRMKGAGRPEGFDGPDGSDERSEKKPSRQIVKANREDEADGENEGTGIVKVRPTVVLDGSDEAEERSTAENQGASPTKKPVVVAAEMGGKPYGSNPVSAGSTAEIRSKCPRSGGRHRGGMRSGFRGKYFRREPAAKDQVWVRKEEILDAPPSAGRGEYTETAGVSSQPRLLEGSGRVDSQWAALLEWVWLDDHNRREGIPNGVLPSI